MILRLEPFEHTTIILKHLKNHLLDQNSTPLNQNEANNRVAYYRDQIIELNEFLDRHRIQL